MTKLNLCAASVTRLTTGLILQISLVAIVVFFVHIYNSPHATATTANVPNSTSSDSSSDSSGDSGVVVNYDDPNMAITSGYVSEAISRCLPSEDAGEKLDECVANYHHQPKQQASRRPVGTLGEPIDIAKILPIEIFGAEPVAGSSTRSGRGPLRAPAKSISK